jgi:prepilin-type N-terminal cleavage/methylation domain-containing protein/prepilin-type processing-associated H-X9-DG protein
MVPKRHPNPCARRPAFTLTELLVVIGVIGILLAILLPVVATARRSARATQCASNLRQVATALIAYSNNYRGSFPPNSLDIDQLWFQKPILGPYLPSPIPMSDDTLAGGVLVCPSDADDAARSYAMNTFASSYVSSFVRDDLASPHPRGKLYRLGVKSSSRIILLADSWSEIGSTAASGTTVYTAQAIVGWVGDTPGIRFGTGPGVAWDVGRFPERPSQIAFDRHRANPFRKVSDPDGAANFAFADGHVSLHRSTDLADFTTAKSRYLALWSQIDPEVER